MSFGLFLGIFALAIVTFTVGYYAGKRAGIIEERLRADDIMVRLIQHRL